MDNIQDFLCELGMKPNDMHLWEIVIFYYIMSWSDLQAAYQNYEQSRQKLGTFIEK